jgi:hypothetical protein
VNYSIIIAGQSEIRVLTRYKVYYSGILCELWPDIIKSLIERNILSDLRVEQSVALTKFFSKIVLVSKECITNI